LTFSWPNDKERWRAAFSRPALADAAFRYIVMAADRNRRQDAFSRESQ